MQNNQHKLSLLYVAARLHDVLETLDEVHTAASNTKLDTLNARGQAELIAWLREIAYVATEAAAEIENASNTSQPTFRVIEGGANGDDEQQDSDGVPYEPGLRVLVAEDTSTPFQVVGR
jgi:hypothetical protein